MIKNIWSKIWDRIKDDPKKLCMWGFFTNGRVPLWSEDVARNHECAAACCVLGWGWIIATEEGLELPLLADTVVPTFEQVFGEKYPSEDKHTPFYDLCYHTSDDKAYEIVRQRALEDVN
jgi:hypothetical protein